MSDVQHPAKRPGDEQRLFELLDRYVRALQREDLQTRSTLLERHGELADLLACLDSLEVLAPPAALSDQRPASLGTDSAPTVLQHGDDGSDELPGPPHRGPTAPRYRRQT